MKDAKECRTRLYSNGRFDLTCRDDLWLGRGEWRSDGKRITFDFESLSQRKAPAIKTQASMTYQGHGNTLETELGEWHRGESSFRPPPP